MYAQNFSRSGHQVRVLEIGDWDRAAELTAGCDAVIVTVPIRATKRVIEKLAPFLAPDTLLADFTSHKAAPLACMMKAHSGPVVGLHPMHGPDVQNLSKQLLIMCPGRRPEKAQWLLEQMKLWGMRLAEMAPERHDEGMHLIQGLRHFQALLHGSYLAARGLRPESILKMSSPVYRAELMMTGRLFAQNPELYADIVLADPQRRELLLGFLDHHNRLAEMVRNDDKAGFVKEFRRVSDFFGEFAEQALAESSYLIHRLADRFA
jgi:chorismate mutase / prephenate dehydrogenase